VIVIKITKGRQTSGYTNRYFPKVTEMAELLRLFSKKYRNGQVVTIVAGQSYIPPVLDSLSFHLEQTQSAP